MSLLKKSNNKTIGEALLGMADKRVNDARIDRAVAIVSELMRAIEERETIIEKHNIVIARAKARIDAIRAGEFSFSSDGQLTFDETEHNTILTHDVY